VKRELLNSILERKKAMASIHLERRKSCEKSDRRADGRKERKRKATYHDARRYQSR
jgi:hypothetical protein